MASTYGGSEFSDNARKCGDLSSQLAVIGQQGMNMSGASTGGDICSQVSQAQPQNAGGGSGGGNGGGASNDPYNQQANNPNDPYGCQTNPSSPACIQCTNDPTNPMCKGLMDNKIAEGQAGFGGPEGGPSPNDFNVGNLADAGGLNDSFMGAGLQSASAGAAIPNKTVPNNSGGALPGEGGGSTAKLDSPSRGGGGGRPSVNTNIEQGFRSGGGGGFAYASGSNTGTDPGGGGGYQGRGGRGPSSDDGGMTGLDLRKYLPGGSLAPGRRMGGIQPASQEINGPGVDIFERITRRMHEKCRLGYLLGCG